jgi:ribosomal protein S13
MLTDSVGITMRHIRVRDLANLTDEKKSTGDTLINTAIASIETIFDADSVHVTDESTKDELEKFVNSLNRSQMKQIEEFIENTPKVEADVKFTCSNPECGHANEITLTGTKSFFE